MRCKARRFLEPRPRVAKYICRTHRQIWWGDWEAQLTPEAAVAREGIVAAIAIWLDGIWTQGERFDTDEHLAMLTQAIQKTLVTHVAPDGTVWRASGYTAQSWVRTLWHFPTPES